MNRTLKDATIQRYCYDTHEQLRQHLADFLAAHNFAKRLKILKGLTPHEYVCQTWITQPQRFKLNPTHNTTGRTPSTIRGSCAACSTIPVIKNAGMTDPVSMAV